MNRQSIERHLCIENFLSVASSFRGGGVVRCQSLENGRTPGDQMAGEQQDQLASKRRQALAKLATDCGADGAVLFLVEQHDQGSLLVPSYAIGSSESFSNVLKGYALLVRGTASLSQPTVEIEKSVEETLSTVGWRSDGRRPLVRSIPSPLSGCQENGGKSPYIAFVALEFADTPPEISDSELAPIQGILISSRDGRFKDAILKLHAEIVRMSQDKTPLGPKIARLLATELGAERQEVRPIPSVCHTGSRLANSEQVAIEFVSKESEISGASFVTLVKLTSSEFGIPQDEVSYRLKRLPFSSPDRATERLDRVLCASRSLIFSQKNVPGYLQSFFSEADRQIATTILNVVRGYEELGKEEGVALQALTLEREQSVELEDNAMLRPEIIRDQHICSLYEIQIDIAGKQIELLPSSIFGSDELPEEYLERLKGFCRKFYFNGENCEDLQVGLDVGSRVFHEFHMPSTQGYGAFYVVEYVSEFLPCATYASVSNQMESHFLRIKRQELLHSRSEYMTEHRHVVINYFSTARDALNLMKTDWDLALKDHSLWSSLQRDEGFTDLFDTANWALNHANLILESGRFLVREIDSQSIRRTNTNLEDIVADCRRVLQFQRKRKGLVWHQKIQGKRPSHLYADSVLLRIAMLNLFDNAVKYAPNKSQVRWVISYQPESYRFSISNVGDHIEPERFNLLLQMGFRGKQVDQLNVRPGTGIGLTVANKILMAHSPMSRLMMESTPHTEDGRAENIFYFDMPYLTGVEHWDKAGGRIPNGD